MFQRFPYEKFYDPDIYNTVRTQIHRVFYQCARNTVFHQTEKF